MWLIILMYIVALILVVTFGLITYARWNFGKLEKQGVPVVEPSHFLLGGALLSFEKNGGLLDIENMKKYGTVFGLYEGREPQIFICDQELIRLITTKDADHFDAKRPIDFGEPLFNEMLDFQPLEKWKTMRSFFTPAVNNSFRLGSSGPVMREVTSEFIANIKEKIKASGNNRLENYALDSEIFLMLTDLLARSMYNINYGKSLSRFSEIVRKVMSPPAVDAPWIATYSYAFPFIKSILPNTLINPEPCQEFIQVLNQIMEMRRKQYKETGVTPSGSARDYLDYIIEWHDSVHTNPEFKKNNITKMTIYSLGIMIFIGGQDQISLLLGVLMYYLSKNPDIETRLQKEVDRVWDEKKGNIDHEALSEMTFLNACVLEATRLYPFFFRGERVCTKDWKEPSRGLTIKKGDVVQIALWAANRNPDYFDDPEEFKPERFMPGNKEKMHPYAFTSFGFGPRNCTGKRMSIELMMLLGAYLVRELRFVKTEKTSLTFLPAGPFFAAHEPIVFDVEARQV